MLNNAPPSFLPQPPPPPPNIVLMIKEIKGRLENLTALFEERDCAYQRLKNDILEWRLTGDVRDNEREKAQKELKKNLTALQNQRKERDFGFFTLLLFINICLLVWGVKGIQMCFKEHEKQRMKEQSQQRQRESQDDIFGSTGDGLPLLIRS